jgi:nucleoside-diphosphate kinase
VSGKHIGEVIRRIEEADFKILAMEMLRLSRQEARQFYLVHKEKPFYSELVEYMSSGPVVALVLEKENCVEAFRQFIGATDPQQAKEGTIRRDYGTNIQNNCVHASDSPQNAQKEISFFFSSRNMIMNS